MRRRILILLAAAVLALISGTAVVAYARTADQRALRGQAARWVLLATGTIPANTSGADIRTRGLARRVQMPSATVPSGALTDLGGDLDGLRLNAALRPDQMLMRGQFAASAVAASPAPTFAVPRGRLAVSLRLAVDTQVAGNVDPGDEVAVFATYPRDGVDTDDAPVTSVVLPRVPVISVGERAATPAPTTATPSASASSSTASRLDAGGDGSAAENLDRYLVTLAVTPGEAQQLINTAHTSDLRLALIGPDTRVSPGPDDTEDHGDDERDGADT